MRLVRLGFVKTSPSRALSPLTCQGSIERIEKDTLFLVLFRRVDSSTMATPHRLGGNLCRRALWSQSD